MRRVLGICCLLMSFVGCDGAAPLPTSGGCLSPTDPDLKMLKKEVTKALKSEDPGEFDFELTDVSGEPIRKSDFEGKVLIVDIWGTWCPPCRNEIPHFKALHETYGSKGLAIVGLNSERGPPDAQAQSVRDYKSRAGIPYRCAIITDKVLNQISPFEGFPTTLFFDRKGKLRLKVVGYNDMIVLQAMVEALLDE
ncbi:MAG: TlpA disulfide reductase family protein [Planctomycetota bacterium]|nr:TlpA disulfide reductase family protein [Planctomycetota bacterium]